MHNSMQKKLLVIPLSVLLSKKLRINTSMEMITYTDLFFGKWSKGSVIFHTSNYVEPHSLLSKYQLNVFIFVKKLRNIKTCFLQDLHSTQRTNGSTFISARLHCTPASWGREKRERDLGYQL